MLAAGAGQVAELGTAAEAVGEYSVVGPHVQRGRQELQCRDRYRDVVVATLDAEVAGQSAAAPQPMQLRTRPPEQFSIP